LHLLELKIITLAAADSAFTVTNQLITAVIANDVINYIQL